MATTKHAGRDTIAYFQLGQGPSSILRDLPMLTVAAARRWRIIGHLHGGGWRTGLDQVPAPLRRLYLRVLERSDTIVILAPRLAVMFDGLGLSDRLRDRQRRRTAPGARSGGAPEPLVGSTDGGVPVESDAREGHRHFLDAARLAVEEQPALRFVVAGGADAPVDTSSWPANVVYRGVVHGADKESLLAEAQLLALPTRYWVEGEPISILEAFHFGLPVVSCDQGGIADLVGPDNGAIVPANDPVAARRHRHQHHRPGAVGTGVGRNRRQARSEHSLDAHLAAMFDLFGVSA
ncbi:MAG: glycosyltransferase [Acidimicrobiales bacterium]